MIKTVGFPAITKVARQWFLTVFVRKKDEVSWSIGFYVIVLYSCSLWLHRVM